MKPQTKHTQNVRRRAGAPTTVVVWSAVIGAALVSGCVQIRTPDTDVRYIAFGDSTTAGPSERDYPDILRSLLDEPEASFANEGLGGETSDEGLERLEGLLADGIFPEAETLLYWEGGNDITDFIQQYDPFLLTAPDATDFPFSDELAQRLADTQANIEASVRAANGAGLRVYLTTYFFLREDIGSCDALPLDIILPGQAQHAHSYIAMLNQRIRAASASQGTILVDVELIADTIREDADNYENCNHMSEQGNTIVANLFLQVVTR